MIIIHAVSQCAIYVKILLSIINGINNRWAPPLCSTVQCNSVITLLASFVYRALYLLKILLEVQLHVNQLDVHVLPYLLNR